MRVLRRFGLVTAAWSTMLAVTAPAVTRPGLLWVGIGALWSWAVVSQFVDDDRVWGIGWLVVACGSELLGPAAGTAGWSVAGGATLLVLTAAALTTNVGLVVAAVVALSATALLRGAVSDAYSVTGSIGTLLLFAFSGIALTWLVRVIVAGSAERDRLRDELAAADRARAVADERAEAAAQLHDSVLQHLTAIGRVGDAEQAQRLATRASADLRTFIRGAGRTTGSLREAVETAVDAAADGREVALSGAGDCPLDATTSRLVEAVGEAVRNAARHTDGDIRVYTEVRGDTATVFVGDQGPGFELATIPADRLGVRDSIVGRLERAGGAATLRRTGTGSEWELTVPLA